MTIPDSVVKELTIQPDFPYAIGHDSLWPTLRYRDLFSECRLPEAMGFDALDYWPRIYSNQAQYVKPSEDCIRWSMLQQGIFQTDPFKQPFEYSSIIIRPPADPLQTVLDISWRFIGDWAVSTDSLMDFGR